MRPFLALSGRGGRGRGREGLLLSHFYSRIVSLQESVDQSFHFKSWGICLKPLGNGLLGSPNWRDQSIDWSRQYIYIYVYDIYIHGGTNRWFGGTNQWSGLRFAVHRVDRRQPSLEIGVGGLVFRVQGVWFKVHR